MLPTIFTIGSISISTFGFVLLLAFVVGSFLVWRSLRDAGQSDEKIFDHLLLTAATALLGARLFYSLTHFDLFSQNLLRIFLLWRYPGVTFWGAIIFGLVFGMLFANKQKMPLSTVFDCYAKAVPLMVILVGVGVFLDGTVLGMPTTLPFGVETGLAVGKRHPVGLYGALGGVVMLLGVYFLNHLVVRRKLPKSVVGWSTLSALGLLQLGLAFTRADLLYFEGISLELLLAAVLTVGPLGPLFVQLNGPDMIHGLFKKLKNLKKK